MQYNCFESAGGDDLGGLLLLLRVGLLNNSVVNFSPQLKLPPVWTISPNCQGAVALRCRAFPCQTSVTNFRFFWPIIDCCAAHASAWHFLDWPRNSSVIEPDLLICSALSFNLSLF